ncbi:Hypothetical_protein [Hexamita inflata]|uniref:Hypothetical_protein n=1 Tax=Hexamita inflata TaxID=28002 RepID=A0AA86UY45_9EUKA|nr:Hypothetical protein HINF_LOCUS60299 [Hexamita inflata]
MKDFISKIYGGQAGLEKRIRGSNNWCTDAICNLQLVAQALDLQRTSVFIFNWVNLNDFRYFLITKTMEDFFFQSQPGAQDEVLVLRLIRIIIQVVTVAFILNIQIMNAFLFLEEWNQVGQSGPALNNILMLLQNNSYFTYDLPLPFHNEKSIFLIVKLYNVRQS